jgi:hypothetical protein
VRTRLLVVALAGCGPAAPPVAPAPPPAPVDTADPPLVASAGWTGNRYDCLTLIDDEVALLHLPEGTTDPVVTMTGVPPESHAVTSLGRIGDTLFACDDQLHAIDLGSGATVELGTPCAAVAGFRGGLLLQEMIGQVQFVAIPGASAPQPTGIDPHASRLAVLDNQLYAAWHSTSQVEVYALDRSVALGTITLRGFDSWVQGMAPMSDGRLIVSSVWPEEKLLIFELNTGEVVGEVPWHDPMVQPQGLLCEIRP